MSIYDEIIPADVADIFSDESGFAVAHDVDGEVLNAIVHNAQISGRSSLVDLAAVGADLVVIVKRADYGENLPVPGAIFFLDGTEYRVQNSSRIGGILVKIALNRIEA